jgi:uncharacterized membrane protein YkvA (DUF1232 family)
MSSNPNPAAQKLNVFVTLINRLRLVVRLLRDARVPIYLKIIPFLSLIYIVMPFDLVPDLVPVLGQLDDLGIFVLSMEAFIMLSPQDVVQEHLAAIKTSGSRPAHDDVVDGEWHTVGHD